MFDLDEALHALEGLDAEGRKALRLAERVWAEVHMDPHGRLPSSITDRYVAELSERREEVRELRAHLDDVLDDRERLEVRAEKAESQLAKTRALATHWGLADELDQALTHWPSHCRREPRRPPPWDDDRIDQLEAAVKSLRRESRAAREAEFVAIQKMQRDRARTAKAVEAEHRAHRVAEHQRDRALGAERRVAELQDEVGRLRSQLDF